MLIFRSSRSGLFLGKGVSKICSKFPWEHPCESVISLKLLRKLIEITLRQDVHLWTCSGRLLLNFGFYLHLSTPLLLYCQLFALCRSQITKFEVSKRNHKFLLNLSLIFQFIILHRWQNQIWESRFFWQICLWYLTQIVLLAQSVWNKYALQQRSWAEFVELFCQRLRTNVLVKSSYYLHDSYCMELVLSIISNSLTWKSWNFVI